MPVNPAKPATPGPMTGSLATDCWYFYPLTEGSGTAPADAAGGAAGSLVGSPPWIMTGEGPAISYSAFAGFLARAVPLRQGDFTIAVRLRIQEWGGLYCPIIDAALQAITTYCGATNLTMLGTPGQITFPSAPHGMVAGTAYTITLTRTGGTLTCAVDGVAIATCASTSTSSADVAVAVGPNPSGGGQAFTADFLGLGAWSRAITGGEITALVADFWLPIRASAVSAIVPIHHLFGGLQ